jgi:hypothetical protein
LQLISYEEKSDSEFNFEHEVFVRAKSRRLLRSPDQFEPSAKEDRVELTDYERRRQRNVEDHEKLFR